MIEAFLKLDPKLQAAVISAGTTLLVLLLGWIWKIFYDRHSLNQKLKLEYTFAQQKSIKEQISKSKTPLLQSAENLNYRLWNLLAHKDEQWLALPPEKWMDEKHHYIRSFVYKWISLIYWILEAEKSVGGYDATLSPKTDLLYLKYIKALKFCLCDRLLIEGLGYRSTDTTNHFYIDDLARFASFVESDGDVIEFHEFEKKARSDHKSIEKVFAFFSATGHEPSNKSMNMLRSLHLLIIQFLNTFGHEYQQTDGAKVSNLVKEQYADFRITKQFREFLVRHKIDKSMKPITKQLAEQVGADQPATALESNSQGNSKPQPESKERPQ